jgi:hypothetical protein
MVGKKSNFSTNREELVVTATAVTDSDKELLDSPVANEKSEIMDLRARLAMLEAQMATSSNQEPVVNSPIRRPRSLVRGVEVITPRRTLNFSPEESRSFRRSRRRDEDHALSPVSKRRRRDSPESRDRPSVFSRLGKPQSPDRSVEESSDSMDMNWSALIDLGLLLAGRAPKVPEFPLRSGGGLLPSEPFTRPSAVSFPASDGVVNSLTRAFDRFTLGHNMDEVSLDQMPGDVTTKPPVAKFAYGFNVKFHGGSDFPLSAKSATPNAEEMSYLRPGIEPAVPIGKVGDIEVLLRRSVRCISSLDWLLSTLKEVLSLPQHDQTVVDSLWNNITKILGYSTDMLSGAVISSVILRREAFLRSCDTLKVPRRTHAWATLRPILGSSSLLGDASEVLRQAAKEDREAAFMSSVSASSRAPRQTRDHQSRDYGQRDYGQPSNVQRSAKGRGQNTSSGSQSQYKPQPFKSRGSRSFRGSRGRGKKFQ